MLSFFSVIMPRKPRPTHPYLKMRTVTPAPKLLAQDALPHHQGLHSPCESSPMLGPVLSFYAVLAFFFFHETSEDTSLSLLQSPWISLWMLYSFCWILNINSVFFLALSYFSLWSTLINQFNATFSKYNILCHILHFTLKSTFTLMGFFFFILVPPASIPFPVFLITPTGLSLTNSIMVTQRLLASLHKSSSPHVAFISILLVTSRDSARHQAGGRHNHLQRGSSHRHGLPTTSAVL